MFHVLGGILGYKTAFDAERSDAILSQTMTPSVNSTKESGSAAPRVFSIDIFRGLNMLLMIFVNNISEVKGLPWWTYHRGDVNGMTYVDMVFPGFLFLMGMSIPLSVEAREARGQSRLKIWTHVVTRSLSLLALGLFIANALRVNGRDPRASGMWWTVLGIVGIALAWLRFPGEKKRRLLYRTMRYVGLALIAVLFMVFRRVTPGGQIAGLDFSYWEILGLLGWAYLLVSAIYLLSGKRLQILAAAFAVMVALNAFSTLGWLQWMNAGPFSWNPFEAGLSSLTMAGVLASYVVVGDSLAVTPKQKARWIVVATAILFAVGFALEPLGISKNRDTPTWCLYCTGANLLVALLLYWIADVKGWKAWASFAKPAGENPLFPYILAYIPYLLPPLYLLTALGTSGTFGVLKSALLTALMLLVSTLLMRTGTRLRI